MGSMNAPHLHLLANHVPVLGIPFAFALLAFGHALRNVTLLRAGLVALVAVALLAIPAYLSGEPAADTIESMPGVEKARIEEHEEAAEIAFPAVLVLGAAALVGLGAFRGARTPPRWFGWAMVAGAVVVGGLLAWTANEGGLIRHAEIRPGFTAGPEG